MPRHIRELTTDDIDDSIKYPECAKLEAAKDTVQIVGDFLTWLIKKKKISLGKVEPWELVTEYYGINLLKAGKEQLAKFVDELKKTKK